MKALPADTDLATRKLLLQQRSAVLRELLSVQVSQTVAPVLNAADRIQAGGHWMKQHPALLAAVAVGLLAWRPRGALKWAGKGWTLWQTWQRIAPLVSKWMATVAAESDKKPGAEVDAGGA